MRKIAFIVAILCLVSFIPAKLAGSGPPIYKGTASWYSEEDPAILKTTANMEIFDDSVFTCAMWGIPFNTILRVTNLENKRSVYVRVNDRGPARRLVNKGRIIDLTKEAFSHLDTLDNGLIKVSVEII